MTKGHVLHASITALLLSACAVSINGGAGGGSGGQPAANPPPPRPAAPPPPPPAAPPPPASPPPARTIAVLPPSPPPATPAQPTVNPTPAPPPAGSSRFGGLLSHVNPGVDAREPVNIAKLEDIKKRDPKACGPMEVAQGIWVRLECHQYTPITKAKQYMSPRKSKYMQARQLYLKQRPIVPANMFQMRKGPMLPGQAQPGGEKAGGAPGADGPVKLDGDQLPSTVDHRADGLEGPVKDQGMVGACTAFSLSTTIDNQLKRMKRQGTASPSHVWSYYGQPSMAVAGDQTLGKSVTTVDTWPVKHSELCKLIQPSPYPDECEDAYGVRVGTAKSDPEIQKKLTAAEKNAPFGLRTIKRLTTQPPNEDEIVTALASGNSLWIAMKIDGRAWTNSKMKNYVIPDWSAISGGHAVVMSGYRDVAGGRQYLIHNSWGTSWGDKGYAWVSQAMVQKYMHYAYVVSLEGDAPPAPNPPGPNPPGPNPPKKDPNKPIVLTDDDCDADELVDIGTGQCAVICADDSRPFNGQCGIFPNFFGGGAKK
ncbi:MAG: C1 family peptidase [Myxococcales bacterium]|nr:C1 family peptidase [Myxococcales bacterium]